MTDKNLPQEKPLAAGPAAGMQDENAILRTLLDSISDEIWFSDTQGRFTLANKAAQKEFRLDPQQSTGVELLAKSMEVYRPDGSPRPIGEAPPLRALLGETVRNEEEIVRTPANSELRHRQVSASPIRDSDGRIIGSVSVVRDITEHKRAEAAVQASLREKEILLREIHHRVKNNMQVVSSLLNLQAETITDENTRRMLREAQMRIHSMALVHKQLYRAQDLSKIDFADYLQSLAIHLFQYYRVKPGQIRLETHLEHVQLGINSAVPCGLLFNELISNALKHAFPDGREGKVGIGLRRKQDGDVELWVEDDGAGLPDSVDFNQSKSLGFNIVTLLVGQLEGTIELNREKGATFLIIFREPEIEVDGGRLR